MSKLKRKRPGRKRKQGVVREPNGRVSRSGIEHEAADKLALETRMRRTGVSVENARDQKASTFIGRLCMLGPSDGLSQAQYEGALAYLEFRAKFHRAIKSPAAIYDSEALGGTGEDPQAYAEWVKDTCEEWRAIQRSLQETQNYVRENLWAAVNLVIHEDQEMQHLIGATRHACNVFARHFRTVHPSRKAA